MDTIPSVFSPRVRRTGLLLTFPCQLQSGYSSNIFLHPEDKGVPIADALKNPLTPAWTSGRGETLAWWDFILDDWMTFIGRYTAEVCVCRYTVNFRRSLPLTVLLWVQAFFASLILFDSSMLYRHLLPAVFSCSSSCGEHPPRFLSNLNRPVPSAWATSMARWLPSLALNMSYPNIDPDSKPFLIVSSLYFFHVSFLHI